MATPHVDKNIYMSDPRFAKLREQGVSWENFKNNQSYYLQQLSTTSVMDLYNKGKAEYEKYTELYNQSNNLFIQYKNQQTKNYAKYDEILQTMANNSKTGEPTSADRSQAARESGYTTELIHNTRDAEIMSEVYLDGRRNAVSMQARGLGFLS